MNLNLTKLLAYLKINPYPGWNYYYGSPAEVFPILWPEMFKWESVWDCIEFVSLPPNTSPSEALAEHFGVSVEDYHKLFISLDEDILDSPVSQERFIQALEEYITTH
jgi:hypothetical protein